MPTGCILDIYPGQAQFKPGEPLSFHLETSGDVDSAKLTVTDLHRTVFSQIFSLKECGEAILTLETTISKRTGFGLEVELLDAQGRILDRARTAFDIALHWREAPRYGFLSDFGPQEAGDLKDVDFLLKNHINIVQFYDWMYRHEQLVAADNVYVDPLGRTISLEVVTEKIAALRARGMKAIAYGAIYASSKDFL